MTLPPTVAVPARKPATQLTWALAIVAGLLTFAVLANPWFTCVSERVHALIPPLAFLYWLRTVPNRVRDSGGRRRVFIGSCIGAGTVLLFWVGFASAAGVQASVMGGRCSPIEPVWMVWETAGYFLIYAVLSRGVKLLLDRISIKPFPRRAILIETVRALICLALFGPYLFCAFNVHRFKVENVSTPAKFGLAYQDVHFPAATDGLDLAGWFIPSPGSRCTVLICHGIGANKSCFMEVVPFLHKAGYNVLMFDFRGHGNSAGHTTTFGVNEARDVEGAAAFLANRPDSRTIIGYGFSMGGSGLLHAAPHLPQMKTLIVDSTFADFPILVQGQLDPLPVPLRPALASLVGFYGYLETEVKMSEMSSLESVSALGDRRLLIIHGRNDPQIPPAQAHMLSAADPGVHRLLMLPGGHCGGHANFPKVYEGAVLAWMSGAVNNRATPRTSIGLLDSKSTEG